MNFDSKKQHTEKKRVIVFCVEERKEKKRKDEKYTEPIHMQTISIKTRKNSYAINK